MIDRFVKSWTSLCSNEFYLCWWTINEHFSLNTFDFFSAFCSLWHFIELHTLLPYLKQSSESNQAWLDKCLLILRIRSWTFKLPAKQFHSFILKLATSILCWVISGLGITELTAVYKLLKCSYSTSTTTGWDLRSRQHIRST